MGLSGRHTQRCFPRKGSYYSAQLGAVNDKLFQPIQRMAIVDPDQRASAAVEEAANDKLFQPIRRMAIVDPNQRASAADILKDVFHGKGLTTPRN